MLDRKDSQKESIVRFPKANFQIRNSRKRRNCVLEICMSFAHKFESCPYYLPHYTCAYNRSPTEKTKRSLKRSFWHAPHTVGIGFYFFRSLKVSKLPISALIFDVEGCAVLLYVFFLFFYSLWHVRRKNTV